MRLSAKAHFATRRCDLAGLTARPIHELPILLERRGEVCLRVAGRPVLASMPVGVQAAGRLQVIELTVLALVLRDRLPLPVRNAGYIDEAGCVQGRPDLVAPALGSRSWKGL